MAGNEGNAFNIPISAPVTVNPSSGIGGNISFAGVNTGGGSSGDPLNGIPFEKIVLYAGLAVLGLAVLHRIARK